MNNTALITGASGGIGLALATIHAQHGNDLIIVARSADKLLALKSELENKYRVKVHCITQDLAAPNAAQELYNSVQKANITVKYLINNAGFGDFGLFAETNWEKEQKMIALNITTLTHLTKLFTQHMIANGGGKIMNVASTAAFQPGPLMAVYFATKAYVLSFSEALHNELQPQGITVTALCPGLTESGFVNSATMPTDKRKKLPTSKEVAEYGYKAMMAGKAVAIHGILNTLITNLIRFTPRAMVVKFTRSALDK